MMKIALLGDRHISSRSPRYQHALSCWRWVINDAVERGVTAFVGLGDVCEGDSDGEERMELGRLYQGMLTAGPVFEVMGNHEHRHALRWLEFLNVSVAWDAFRAFPLTDEVTLLLAPYARKGHAPYDNLDGATISETARACADRLAAAIQAETDQGKAVIVAGHWSVEGFRIADTEREVHVSHEMVVPISALEPAALVVTGHIHHAQQSGERIVGAGSLYRTSFSEAEQEKSYVLATIEGRSVTWQRVPVPTREMIVATAGPADFVRVNGHPLSFDEVAGKEVKVIVHIPADRVATCDLSWTEPIKARAALFVLEKRVIPVDRVRAPQLGASGRLDEELVTWLTATDQVVDVARMDRLAEKVAEVESR